MFVKYVMIQAELKNNDLNPFTKSKGANGKSENFRLADYVLAGAPIGIYCILILKHA